MKKQLYATKVVFFFLILMAFKTDAIAQPAVEEVRQINAQQIAIKMTSPPTYQVFQLSNPARLFVYIYGSGLKTTELEK